MAKKLHKEEKGFTLIELIVVVAVLGILATIAVPRVIRVTEKANTNTEQANLTIIKNALERYYAENGDYPDELKILKPTYLDIEDDILNKYKYEKKNDSYTLSINNN
jgi:general secretion pathway protein G/type IV pilus assembly protein PilA